MRRRWIALVPLMLTAFVLFVALGGVVVRALWNWLLPPLFGWPAIGYWQALGLLALSRILFGGGLSMQPSPRARRPLSERWKEMSPEERERFRRGLWGRLGFAPTTSEHETP